MIFVLASLFRRSLEPLSRADLEELADEELMLRYAAGDVAAFEILLGRHERKILNFVYRSIGDRARAEEVTQDVFLRVVRSAERYKKSARFTTWLYTIARNACIDEARRARRHRTVSLDAPVGDEGGATFVDLVVDEHAAGGAGSLSRQEFHAKLREGLAALPDEQREVFILRQYDGMKFVDIAGMLDLSENTVKSRMRYALATLRGYLADFEGFSFDATDREEVAPRAS